MSTFAEGRSRRRQPSKQPLRYFTGKESFERPGALWLDLAKGEPRYDDLENRLAEGPVIAVPAITLEGDANGAPHADAAAYSQKFVGKYVHRVVAGGIGHNLPQEAPQAFAQAVVDVDGF